MRNALESRVLMELEKLSGYNLAKTGFMYPMICALYPSENRASPLVSTVVMADIRDLVVIATSVVLMTVSFLKNSSSCWLFGAGVS